MTKQEIIQHEKIVLEGILVSPTFVIPESLSTKNPFINIIVEKTNSVQLRRIRERYDDDYTIYSTDDGRIEIGISLYNQLKEAEAERPKKQCTLHPFTAVMVRDEDTEKWTIDLFSHLLAEEETPHRYICMSMGWEQCIPYNPDTKHLLGTADPCPFDYEIEFEL